MRKRWRITSVVFCFVAVAFSLSAREPERSANVYPYGTTTCLQGNDGPGLRLFLKQRRSCQGNLSYPYLELHIKEHPIPVHKSISIGPENRAFRCVNPKESCKQALSGYLWFDHFEDSSGNGIHTDGHFELRFNTGGSESSFFEVDCYEPCG
jgi:hypothetical protein